MLSWCKKFQNFIPTKYAPVVYIFLILLQMKLFSIADFNIDTQQKDKERVSHVKYNTVSSSR
jgi:hypothetical protein